jgi:hypothetical protein
MDPYLRELIQLVPPPSDPQNAKGDWKQLESDLGLTFPDDYKQYIKEYGSGTLCALFEIGSPFRLESHYKKAVKDAWSSWAGIYHGWGDVPESEIPFPIYPKIPGLLPWGTYGDVDVLVLKQAKIPGSLSVTLKTRRLSDSPRSLGDHRIRAGHVRLLRPSLFARPRRIGASGLRHLA